MIYILNSEPNTTECCMIFQSLSQDHHPRLIQVFSWKALWNYFLTVNLLLSFFLKPSFFSKSSLLYFSVTNGFGQLCVEQIEAALQRCSQEKVFCFACNFIEITRRHGCSPVNVLDILKAPFPKNTSGGLLLRRGVVRILSNIRGGAFC